MWKAVGGAATSAAKEERLVEICWEEEVGETEVQMMAKERPSAMAMLTLAMKPNAADEAVGGARLSVLVARRTRSHGAPPVEHSSASTALHLVVAARAHIGDGGERGRRPE